MIFRILLFLLPLLFYLFWLLSRNHSVKRGKNVRVIPRAWQYGIFTLVVIATAALFYFGFSFSQNKDSAYEPFRPQTYIEQNTTR